VPFNDSATKRQHQIECLNNRELKARAEARCGAPPGVVYGLLVDLKTHASWGGAWQPRNRQSALLHPPEGNTIVGTEFESTGTDPKGRFSYRSVVTDVARPSTFEFVTEARLETKGGDRSDWTLTHRYELAPDGTGSNVTYMVTVARISALAGMLALLRLPFMSRLMMKVTTRVARRNIRNLARMAEQKV
jgi:hypothetical protein